VHVYDLVTDGPKPDLVRDLGATTTPSPCRIPGSGLTSSLNARASPQWFWTYSACRALDAITCLTGVSGTGKEAGADIGAMNRRAVLGNEVVFGSVNANRRHYDAAARALGRGGAALAAPPDQPAGAAGPLRRRLYAPPG
jgi:glucose 1-dehydrogenase